jgi:hypothetical protein
MRVAVSIWGMPAENSGADRRKPDTRVHTGKFEKDPDQTTNPPAAVLLGDA